MNHKNRYLNLNILDNLYSILINGIVILTSAYFVPLLKKVFGFTFTLTVYSDNIRVIKATSTRVFRAIMATMT